MAVEFELKYGATEAVLAAIRQTMSGPATVYRMQTTYYDTPDSALSQRHITLRRRMENEVSVCTLKAPAKLGRAEFELERDTIEDAIPELCKLSGLDAALFSQGVTAVCGARFTRQAYTLTYEDTVLELALDQGVLTGGGRELPLCEVEVELKSGDAKKAVIYATALAARHGLQPETKSKFARAIALAKGE